MEKEKKLNNIKDISVIKFKIKRVYYKISSKTSK